MDSFAVDLNGQRFQLPASNESDGVQQSDKNKGSAKKRKQTGQKASNQPSKRPRSKNKTLKPPISVETSVEPDPSNHGSVKADVGKGIKKTGKERQKKTAKKSSGSSGSAIKKKAQPRNAGKTVGKSNLKTPLNATTDKIFGDVGCDGLDSPRESYEGGYLSELCGTEAEIINEKIAHDSYGDLQEQAEAEVTEEHVPVVVEVGESTLINWEHFSLVYEEYCLTKEVNKGV